VRNTFAEMNELPIRTRSRRETLGTNVQRLEQVRLPDTVWPDSKYESGLQVEIEPLVRPEVAELDLVDDQPGRRIGMTRYVKSSPSPWITAGRRGLISFRRTSSPSIDSRPSRRKSALKPISSVSPENAAGIDS
jgi:hypothetical protein